MPKPETTSTRYAHVDSLRGIAALLVVWLHVTEVFKRLPLVRAQGDWLYRIADMVDVGRMGVVIFFAISGFVICSSLQGPTGSASRNFLIKRFFRLYPAYWIAIVLGSFASWHLYGNPLSASLYAANATMIPTLFGYDNMMGLLWTLETELVFYLLCLLLFWSGHLHRPVALAICSIALLGLFAGFKLELIPAPEISAWRSMPYHIAIMLWGGIARHCFDGAAAGNRQPQNDASGLSVRPFHLLAIVAAAILIPLFAIALQEYMASGKTKELTLTAAYSLAMGIFIVGVFFVRLQHRVLVWLGTISYSLYLFHSVFFTPMYLWANVHREHPLAQLHMGIYLAIVVIVSVAFSDLVYRFVEAPCNHFARRLVARSPRVTGEANA